MGVFTAIGAGSVIPILYTYIGSFVNDIVNNIQAFQNETLSNTERDEYSKRLHESATEFVTTVCGLGFVVLVCSFTENETFNYVSLKQVSIYSRLMLSFVRKFFPGTPLTYAVF